MRPVPDWEDWARAAHGWHMFGPQIPMRDIGGIEVGGDPPIQGPARQWCLGEVKGFPCRAAAGSGTDHPGVGHCRSHGGNTRRGRMEAALLTAHTYAVVRKVAPWQALLEEISRTAGALAWLDMKVAQAPNDDALLPDGSHAPWVRMRNEERDRMAKVAKMTMDAGVASALVARAEVSGIAINRVLMNSIADLGLTEEQMDQLRGNYRRELMAIAAEESATVIDGQVIDALT